MQCLVLLAFVGLAGASGTGYSYHGKYPGKCANDGIYYNNENSFVLCSNGNAYNQPCAPGSKNGPYESYSHGLSYGYGDFCGINLVNHGYAANRAYGSYGYEPRNYGYASHQQGYGGDRQGYGGDGYTVEKREYRSYGDNTYNNHDQGQGYRSTSYNSDRHSNNYGSNNYGSNSYDSNNYDSNSHGSNTYGSNHGYNTRGDSNKKYTQVEVKKVTYGGDKH